MYSELNFKTAKYILFTLFLVISVTSASAQIQTKFFDFTLGVSSRTTVLAKLKAKGVKVTVSKDELHTGTIAFGGHKWSKAQFVFVDDKLGVFGFTDSPITSATETAFGELRRTLDLKYQLLRISQNDKQSVFSDLKNICTIGYSGKEPNQEISLVYANLALMMQAGSKGGFEL